MVTLMLNFLKSFFYNDLAIDLGTANTLIYMKNKGIVLNEPTVVAIKYGNLSKQTKNIVAIGLDAKKMLGKTPGNILAIRPLKEGVIADFQITEIMLKYFIKKVYKANFFKPSPRILVCVPCGSTQVERKAIKESVENTGARAVYLIEEPMAAAIGAGLPIDQASGSMIVDIGGGTTEVAIISLNGVVYASSIRIGGDKLDESITNYVRRHYGSLIGDSTAERIKIEIGAASQGNEIKELKVHGRNLAEGVPKSFTLNSDEIFESLQEPLSRIIYTIKSALEQTPPELASDISEKGIVLTGGGSLLKDIDKLISKETNLPVIIAKDPLTCVARGGGKALEIIDEIKSDIISLN